MTYDSTWTRREALRAFGLGFAGFLVPTRPAAAAGSVLPEKPAEPLRFIERWEEPFVPDRPVTAITLGAGARGNVYGGFASAFGEMVDIVGVAEPIPIRRERYMERHAIASENAFTTWEHVFERPKFADAVIITTPDDLHHGPCMKALEMGYDVLLEKPIAPTEAQCREILAQARRTGGIVAVCHVLRYAPYFQKLRALMQSGAVGRVVSLQHFEPIEHVHMAHSFVRGNWHDSKATSPIILAKSCHDLDMLRWLVGAPSQRISAFGRLSWFQQGNAPQGSTARCMDGCAVEAECPYSALRIYDRNRDYIYVFDLPEEEERQREAILEYLRTTNYGRCVYRMDNDQPDHYVCSMEFEGGVTASFNMEAFTSYHGRRTRVMGAMGDIVGDMSTFVHTDFRTGEQTVYDNRPADGDPFAESGHGGGDWRLMHDWVKAVATQDPTVLTSTIEASIESHLMAFAAEESRAQGTVTPITL